MNDENVVALSPEAQAVEVALDAVARWQALGSPGDRDKAAALMEYQATPFGRMDAVQVARTITGYAEYLIAGELSDRASQATREAMTARRLVKARRRQGFVEEMLAIRSRLELTAAETAAMLGVKLHTLRGIESGGAAATETVERLLNGYRGLERIGSGKALKVRAVKALKAEKAVKP